MKNLTAIHAIKNNNLKEIEREKTIFILPYDTIICQNCGSTRNNGNKPCWYCGEYINHCWNCKSYINSRVNKKCDKCNEYYICSECGMCKCDKNPLLRKLKQRKQHKLYQFTYRI